MDDHSRTIIHIDIDCFYAQVEMVKNPSLKDQPLAVQQKHIVVTSNYLARKYGVKKCMPVTEAKTLCPNMVLVNGEDLYEYRQVSNKLTEIVREYSDLVERLGLDENYVDVTDLVNQKMASGDFSTQAAGCIFGDESTVHCGCGCMERIGVGSQIAQIIRDKIYETLHLTTSAGVAHNKLLAKIVGKQNKPNNQTVLFPNSATELMLSQDDISNIPGIGNVTSELLKTINISKVQDLQNCDRKQLENIFDAEKAQHLIDLCFGIDPTPVKRTGKPQSIGLEDACRTVTTLKEVEQKFRELLKRLLILVREDGRIPKALKATVRKGPARESRQCSINIPLNNEAQLINTSMSLFEKVVDKHKPFKITLLGLAFLKFVEKPNEKSTLVSFLSKSRDEKASNLDSTDPSKTSSDPEPISKRRKISESVLPECSGSSSIQTEPDRSENSLELPLKPTQGTECPPGVDPDVFKELPPDLQFELWEDYKRKKEKPKAPETKKSKMSQWDISHYLIRQPKK